MRREPLVFGVATATIAVGVGLLVAGEFFHGMAALVPAGGVVALLGVAGLTAALAGLPEPAAHD